MVRYKIGDKVKIRSDLMVGNWYGNEVFCSGMRDKLGKVVTIDGVFILIERYTFKHQGHYFWTDEMIEGKVVGNRVVRSDL